MGQVNLLRAANFKGDLGNMEALQGLFPGLDETHDAQDAEALRRGVSFHLAESFFRTEGESQVHGQLMRMAVQRAGELEGEAAEVNQAVVVADEEVGVDQILSAVSALREIVMEARVSVPQGLSMLASGMCEFSGGKAAMHEAIRQVYPGIGEEEAVAVAGRTVSYLRQFSGLVVNDVLREIGAEWILNSGPAYLEQLRAAELEYHEPDDSDDEIDEDELDYEPAALDFRI
jgi:hypothetical protein